MVICYLLSSSVDKVTTGTYNFLSVIWNVAFVEVSILSVGCKVGLAVELEFFAVCVIISVKTPFSGYVKIRFITQLINTISNVLQKLLKCFNGTMISRFFLVFVFSCSVFSPFCWSAFDVITVILVSYLKE